jgi:curved DNA-binding protein CbpA
LPKVRTHYDNLKVARNAPPEVIRAAYKSLSQKYHPDQNPEDPDAARIMALINEAYRILSDPIKRREHDEWIRRSESDSLPKAAKQAEPPVQARESQIVSAARKFSLASHLKSYWWIYLSVALAELALLSAIVYLG